MDTKTRKYQYVGILLIKRSRVLKEDILPDEDIVPWLFLRMNDENKKRFTFFYKIEQPLKAFYNEPFIIQLSFIMEEIKKIIELNKEYDVWRGEEFVGKVRIIKVL